MANNPNRGGYRDSGGTRLKSEVYQFLEDGVLQEAHADNLRNLETLFKRPRTKDTIKQIHQVSSELINLDQELNKRGLLEEEEEPDEEDTTSEDAYRAWEEKATGMDQVKATNERLETIRKVDGKKGVRENYKDKKIDGKIKTAFEQLWDEAHDENKAFDRKREANAKKEEARLQKEAEAKAGDERLERVRAEQDYEKQEWDNVERHGAEKETDVLKAHQEAFKEGREGPDGEKIYSEKNFKSYGELYDRAQKDNDELINFRKTTEYKVEKSLEPILKGIERAYKDRSEKIKEYEDSSWLSKMRPKNRMIARKSREDIADLENLKVGLSTEEVRYIEKKTELAKQLDPFPPEDAGKLSKMYEGSATNNKLRAEYKDIMDQMALLEEDHQVTVSEMRRELVDLGVVEASQMDSNERGLREMGVVFEEGEGYNESDFGGVYSKELSADEEIFSKEEERKLRQDSQMRAKLNSLEVSLKERGKVGSGVTLFDFFKGTTDLEVSKRDYAENPESVKELDKQVQREIEKYRRKVLETRIRIRRLMKMIESEKSKDPEKMNLALINEAGKRIDSESLGLYNFGEKMKQNVIKIEHKGRLQKLKDKIPWSGVGF